MRFEDKVRDLRIKKHKGFETETFLEDVKLLAGGERFEYLLGEALFCGNRIDLSYRPMIPREETQYWVTQALEDIENSEQSKESDMLDLFSGSGCIGVSFGARFKESLITFMDSDEATEKQTLKNLEKNHIAQNRAKIVRMDIKSFLEVNQEKYTYIFAVPPYVPIKMKEEVMKELCTEKESFFFDQDDGFFYHTLMLDKLLRILAPRGTFFLECDMTQVATLKNLIHDRGYSIKKIYTDNHGNETAFAITV